LYSFKFIGVDQIVKANSVFSDKNYTKHLQKILEKDIFIIGYFCENHLKGHIVLERRIFFKVFDIWGSPVRGIGTDFQGFQFYEEVDIMERLDIYGLLFNYLSILKIGPMTILDNVLFNVEIEKKMDNFNLVQQKRYVLDLCNNTVDELIKKFHPSSARYSWRKAQKLGVNVKFINDINLFLDSHVKHLDAVFKRKGIPNPYSFNKLSKILESLDPNEYLLSIAYDVNQNAIASNIYLLDNYFAYFYTGASLTEALNLCPNEILMIESLLKLKELNVPKIEFGRGNKYKEKYGPDVYLFYQLEGNFGDWKFNVINKLFNLYKKLRKMRFIGKFLTKLIYK
jgi:hypothetical protein